MLEKQETQVFAQAVDEMKGQQYSNLQQRIYSTGKIIDNEFKNLMNDLQNPTKTQIK